jgi:DNA polymerase-4
MLRAVPSPPGIRMKGGSMAVSPRSPRPGSGCYWPRAFLYLACPRPLTRALGRALYELTPEVVHVAPGEALLDITHCQRQCGPPERIAALVERLAQGGVAVSIGVAATPAIARHAAGRAAGAVQVIPPWETREQMHAVPIGELCDPGPRLAALLRASGLRTCGDLAHLPFDLVARRFGATGRQLWLAAHGRDPALVEQDVAPLAQAVVTRVLPPRTLSARTIEKYLQHLCDKLAARLRRLDLRAGRIKLRLRHAGPRPDIESALALPRPDPDGASLALPARALFRRHWQGEAIARIDISAGDLSNASGQLELFNAEELASLRPRRGLLSAFDGGAQRLSAPPHPAAAALGQRGGGGRLAAYA